VPLIGFLGLTVIAMLLFIYASAQVNKGFVALAWVSGLAAVATGLI
jgi:hypothetical protein